MNPMAQVACLDSVCPDARIKSSPIFTKVAQKGAKVVFVSKERFFKSQKKLPNI